MFTIKLIGCWSAPVSTARLYEGLNEAKTPYDSSRFGRRNIPESEPEPTEDDMIKVHYLKHHPMYEFRNYEEFHPDEYTYWLHNRHDYYNTETSPAEVHPWEQGSKVYNSFWFWMPPLLFYFMGSKYVEYQRSRNNKQPIVNVWSQRQC